MAMLAAGPTLTSCAASLAPPPRGSESRLVRVSNWSLYLDNATPGLFEAQTGLRLLYTDDIADNEELYARLTADREAGKAPYADLVMPTDFVAARLIADGAVAEITPAAVPNKANISPAFAHPPFDPDRRFSLPWVSGQLGVAYNRRLVGGDLTSAEVLFDRAFAGRVMLLSDMRDCLGMVLPLIGAWADTATPAQLHAALDFLERNAKANQVTFTDSDYSTALSSGDLVASQAYSGDAAQLTVSNPDLAFVIPDSGSTLYTDTMVVPAGGANTEGAFTWLNWVYEPENMARIVAYIRYMPAVEGVAEVLARTHPELVDDPLINPPTEVTDRLRSWQVLDADLEAELRGRFEEILADNGYETSA